MYSNLLHVVEPVTYMALLQAEGGDLCLTQGAGRSLAVTVLELKGFRIGGTIGMGAYSVVKKGLTPGKREVAVKIIDRSQAPLRFNDLFLPRELHILQQLNHPHILRLQQIICTRRLTFLITEYMSGGSLLTLIDRHGKVPFSDHHSTDYVRVIVVQMAEALRCLHQQNLIHRDVKDENILLDRFGNVKLGDFGFAREISPETLSWTWCGTTTYTAPELLSRRAYHGPPVDLWSFGVLIYILLIGQVPFEDTDVAKMVKEQEKPLKCCEGMLSEASERVVRGLLNITPEQRWTCDSVRQSDWLMQTPWMTISDDRQVCCF